MLTAKEERLDFSPGSNALLSWDLWSCLVLWLANEWIKAAFCAQWGPFTPSHLLICPLVHAATAKCSKWGPSASSAVFLALKTDCTACLARLSGSEGWSCCLQHLAGCQNILNVVYHVKNTRCAFAYQIRASFLLGILRKVSHGAAGLVNKVTLSKALHFCLLGFLSSF